MGPETSSVTTESGSADEETTDTSTESTDASEGDSSPVSVSTMQLPSGTDDEVTPVTSFLTVDNILTSNTDANDDVVVQGSVADYDSSYGVAVVNSTQYVLYQEQQKSFFAQLSQKLEHFILSLRGPKGRGNPVIPTAHADTSGTVY